MIIGRDTMARWRDGKLVVEALYSMPNISPFTDIKPINLDLYRIMLETME